MGQQTFKLTEIIDVSSTDELIDRAANAVLNSLMYEKPLDYINKLAEILSIETKDLEQDWPVFVELKARRDLGVHNNWIVNEIYLRKLNEAKVIIKYNLGDRVIPDFIYMNEAMNVCEKLIDNFVNLLAEKWISEVENRKHLPGGSSRV